MNICLRLVYRVLLLKDIYTVFKRHEHPSLFHSLRKTDLKKLSNFKPKICWRFVKKFFYLINYSILFIKRYIWLVHVLLLNIQTPQYYWWSTEMNGLHAKKCKHQIIQNIILFILLWKITFYKTCQLQKLNETFIKKISVYYLVCLPNKQYCYICIQKYSCKILIFITIIK